MATPGIREVLSGANTGTILLTTGAGTDATDILICIHGTDFRLASSMTTPTPGTWTLETTADDGENHAHIKVWSRVVGGVGGPQAVTTNDPGGSTGCHQHLYVISGADTSAYSDGAGNSNGGGSANNSQAAPSVSPAGADDLLICAAQDFNSGDYTAPGGMTEQAETDGAFSTMSSATLALAASGATGTKTFTFNNSANYATISMAIKAVAGSSDATVNAATVAGSVTIGAPTISTGSTVSPATVAGTVTIGTPAESVGSTVSPATVAGAVTIGTPTVSTGSTVSPATVAGVVTIGAPTVTGSLSATANPATVQCRATIGTPTITATSVEQTSGNHGWYGLLAIYQDAAREVLLYRRRRPQACPNDGEPLKTAPTGTLYCPFDGWIWDGRGM